MIGKYANIIIIFVIYISVSVCNASEAQWKQYKYMKIIIPDAVRNISYVSNKAMDSILIDLKRGGGYILILCIPYTEREYSEKCDIETEKYKYNTVQYLTVNVSGRKISATKKYIGDGQNSIDIYDYYGGVAFHHIFNGDESEEEIFLKMLKNIQYRVSPEIVELARKNFNDIRYIIENAEAPFYGNPVNKKSEFCVSNVIKRFQYDVYTQNESMSIVEYYNQYFTSMKWMRCFEDKINLRVDGDILSAWIDNDKGIIARLVILSTCKDKNPDSLKKTICLDITPTMAGMNCNKTNYFEERLWIKK